MKTKLETHSTDTPSDAADSKFLGPCVVASLVWLALSVYMLYVVPMQLDIRDQLLKPEQMREALPKPLHFALYFHEVFGATIISALGLLGCGAAYITRSAKAANWMIGWGALCLVLLVWVVLMSIPR